MSRVTDRDVGPSGSPRPPDARALVLPGPTADDAVAARMQRLCFVHSMLLALAVTLGYLASLDLVGVPARIAMGAIAVLLAGVALNTLWRLHDRVNENWLNAAIPRSRR